MVSDCTPQIIIPRINNFITETTSLVLGLNTLLTLERVGGNLLVITLKSSEILTGLRKLTLLHTLTDVPVDESTLGVHEVKLVGECGPGLGDGGGVGKHADGAVDLGEISVWNHLRWLVADTNLETSWAPVDELDGALSLESGNSSVGVLWNDITTVQQAGGHVLSVAWVALNHLVVWLEAGHGDLLDGVGLVGSLGRRDNWGVSDEREVNTWVWDQIGLELVEIDVEGTIKAEGGGDGGNDLGDEAVKVLVVWTLQSEVTSADVVDGLVINHEGTVRVLKGGVGGEDGVVWLDNGGGGLWGWVDAELKLGLLAVVDREALHEEGSETRSGSTTEGVENEETLETRAVVGNVADLVENLVDQLLSDGVVTTGVVVGSILTSSDHLLRVEQRAVGTGADLINHVWLEITVDGTWNILSLSCSLLKMYSVVLVVAVKLAGLREEGAEPLIWLCGLALLSEVSIWL